MVLSGSPHLKNWPTAIGLKEIKDRKVKSRDLPAPLPGSSKLLALSKLPDTRIAKPRHKGGLFRPRGMRNVTTCIVCHVTEMLQIFISWRKKVVGHKFGYVWMVAISDFLPLLHFEPVNSKTMQNHAKATNWMRWDMANKSPSRTNYFFLQRVAALVASLTKGPESLQLQWCHSCSILSGTIDPLWGIGNNQSMHSWSGLS